MKTSAQLRIGVTMRITHAENYVEARDSLSQDWFKYLNDILPDALIIAIPNLGLGTLDYVKKWHLNGFILSGGNDIGREPLRDVTEKHLIEYGLTHHMPILGICRGFQMLIEHFKGALVHAHKEEHAGTIHAVDFVESPFNYPVSKAVMVNSFHENIITNAGEMTPLACDKDKYIEAAYHHVSHCLGLMWHPERDNPNSAIDDRVIKQFFMVNK